MDKRFPAASPSVLGGSVLSNACTSGNCVPTPQSTSTNSTSSTDSSANGSSSTSATTLASTSALTTTETLPYGVPPTAIPCGVDNLVATYCFENNGTMRPFTTVSWATASLNTYTIVEINGSREILSSSASNMATTSSNSDYTMATSSSESNVTSMPTATSTGAAADSTSSSSHQNATASPASKTSTGAVAGAAVGCFIAGLLLAGAVALFFMRKRKNERYARPANYTPAPMHSYGEKGTPMVAISPIVPDFLPQQADDAEVRHRISTVIDQIDQHVENFYINQPTSLTPAMEGELSRFETSQLPCPLAACFERSSQPTVLIKHCLAFHTFNLTMAPGEGTTPILPPEIANMIGLTYSRSISPQVSRDFITAFSSWKRLTAYLRPDLLRDPNSLNKSTEASTRIANHFTDIFTPWRNDAYSDDQRARHLTELLDHAVHTAIWLFGQPDSYRFDWTVANPDMGRSASVSVSVRGRASDRVVVAPGVSKVTHGGSRLPGAGQQIIPTVAKRM